MFAAIYIQIREIRYNSCKLVLLEAAIGQMVIHHPGSLHVGVGNSSSEKFEAAFFHVFADSIGYWRAGGDHAGSVVDRFAIRHKAV